MDSKRQKVVESLTNRLRESAGALRRSRGVREGVGHRPPERRRRLGVRHRSELGPTCGRRLRRVAGLRGDRSPESRPRESHGNRRLTQGCPTPTVLETVTVGPPHGRRPVEHAILPTRSLADDTVPSRLYFHCGDVILALVDWSIEAQGPVQPTPDDLYVATGDLDSAYERAPTGQPQNRT